MEIEKVKSIIEAFKREAEDMERQVKVYVMKVDALCRLLERESVA